MVIMMLMRKMRYSMQDLWLRMGPQGSQLVNLAVILIDLAYQRVVRYLIWYNLHLGTSNL